MKKIILLLLISSASFAQVNVTPQLFDTMANAMRILPGLKAENNLLYKEVNNLDSQNVSRGEEIVALKDANKTCAEGKVLDSMIISAKNESIDTLTTKVTRTKFVAGAIITIETLLFAFSLYKK